MSMEREYDQLDDTHVTDGVFAAEEYDALVRILDSQVHGALAGLGEGVIEGGAVTGRWGSLGVNVAALKAVVNGTKGFTYIQTDSAGTVLDLPAGATVYIFAQALWRESEGDPDSREDASVELTWGYLSTQVDCILLATVTTGGAGVATVTDSRVWCPVRDTAVALDALDTRLTAAEADVAGIKTVLGDGYYDVNGDPVTGQASVHDRLTAQENGGGGGDGPRYWGEEARSSDDPTTIPEFVASQMGTGGGGGGTTVETGATVTVQLPSDLEIANHLRLGLRLIHALPEVEETQLLAYYFVPGISDDALYDAGNTTAPVDKVNHTIG